MPTVLAVIVSRIRGLLLARRLDDEFDEEVSAHLAMLTEEHIRRGLAPDEARRAAVVQFGGPMQIKEQHHDRRGLPLVDTTLQDLRYGLRALRRNPAYSLVPAPMPMASVAIATSEYARFLRRARSP